jgi:hypothetical protein
MTILTSTKAATYLSSLKRLEPLGTRMTNSITITETDDSVEHVNPVLTLAMKTKYYFSLYAFIISVIYG